MGNYGKLEEVLERALAQAEDGKGKERHSTGQDFENQPMCQIAKMVGNGFPLGQAMKKIQESVRLPRDHAVAELLGAINYLAGAIIVLEGTKDPRFPEIEPKVPFKMSSDCKAYIKALEKSYGEEYLANPKTGERSPSVRSTSAPGLGK